MTPLLTPAKWFITENNVHYIFLKFPSSRNIFAGLQQSTRSNLYARKNITLLPLPVQNSRVMWKEKYLRQDLGYKTEMSYRVLLEIHGEIFLTCSLKI